MGVRPPSGDSGERQAIEFGIAALKPIIEEADVEFPADAKTIVGAVGDPNVPVDAKGRSMRLSSAIAESDEDRFESERDLLNTLHPVFESHREAVATGWLATIRSQLPF